MKSAFRGSIAISGILSLLLTACSAATPLRSTPPQDAKPQRGGTLQVGLSQDFGNLDPNFTALAVDRQLLGQVYDGLTELDKNLRPIPSLAESWQIPDPTTYIFKIRSGVKFHDGSSLDAAAVKFNFDRMMNTEIKSLRASELTQVQTVEVVDPLTVRVKLKSAFPALLSVLASRARIVSPAAVAKYGADLVRNPVGAGPFQFVEWVKGDHLTLKRFDEYWGKDESGASLPYLDGITFKALTDDSARLTALRTGTVDFIDNVPPKDLQLVGGESALRLSRFIGPGYCQIYLNTAKPPLDNKALRQAMSYAVDRSVIAKTIYFSDQIIGETLIAPSHAAHDPSLVVYGTKANLDAARQKLREGGRPDGFEFTLEIFNQPLEIQMGELLKSQLAQVGITAKVVPYESTAAVQRVVAREIFSFRACSSGNVDLDTAMNPAFSCKGTLNYMNYCNTRVDELLEAGRTSTDAEQRKRSYQAAQKIILEDAPIMILSYSEIANAMNAKVRGLVEVPDNILRFGGVWRTP